MCTLAYAPWNVHVQSHAYSHVLHRMYMCNHVHTHNDNKYNFKTETLIFIVLITEECGQCILWQRALLGMVESILLAWNHGYLLLLVAGEVSLDSDNLSLLSLFLVPGYSVTFMTQPWAMLWCQVFSGYPPSPLLILHLLPYFSCTLSFYTLLYSVFHVYVYYLKPFSQWETRTETKVDRGSTLFSVNGSPWDVWREIFAVLKTSVWSMKLGETRDELRPLTRSTNTSIQ